MTKRRPLALGAAATIGLGSLFLASPALAVEEAPAPSEASSLETGNKYELAAAELGTSAGDVEQREQAGELVVSEGGFFAFRDPAPVGSADEFVADAAAIPGSPAGGSRPGAPVTIYLDFGGETLTGTNWNVEAEMGTIDFAPATGVNEAQIWAAVAEDYAPFNVNVTTTDPGADALYKTSLDDTSYGSHVIITDTYEDEFPPAAGTGGIAWRGGAGSDFLTGALVFTQGTGSNKGVAEAAAHEAGHNFGLVHDGHGAEEYYAPTEGLWGPTMGATYNAPVTTWSIGDYAGATNTEDDLAVITDHSAETYYLMSVTLPDGTPYDGPVCSVDGSDAQNPQPGDRFQVPNAANECDGSGAILTTNWTFTGRADLAADDHGDTAANATGLTNATGSFEETGVIGGTADVDVFSFSTEGGDITAEVEVADIGANLNAELTLQAADGTVVARNAGDPTRVDDANATGLGASISVSDAAKGTYTLSVTGVGFGDISTATSTNAGGIPEYGSLGNYTLAGTAAPAAEVVEAPAITSPANGSTVQAPVTAISGTGIPGATVTLTGDVTGTATVTPEGTWTVTANLGEGDYSVTAKQTLAAIDSATVTSSFVVEAADSADANAGGASADANGAGADANAGGAGAGADAAANGAGANANAAAGGAGTGANAAANGGSADANGGGLPQTGGVSLLPFGIAAGVMLMLGVAVTLFMARRQQLAEEA